jgi:hypothetical protein
MFYEINPMKKLILLISILLSCFFSVAQTEPVPEIKNQKGFIKLDFLSLKMFETSIANEPNMELTGIHYNLLLNENFYTGVGIYGAVTGKRGGFFTLGINAGFKQKITNRLYIDTGFHFGGGGGASAPDGGGAFILPHLNLGYDFKAFSLNTGWSFVTFFDEGLIKGNQLNVALEIPLSFNYSNYDATEKIFSEALLSASSWKQETKKTSFLVHFNNLKVKNEGRLKGKTINLAGFEFANYFTKNWFAFLKVDGAYGGIKAGFMDVFLGGGYHFSCNKTNTNIVLKLAAGAGGGGGVDSDGGFMLSPDISIEQKIFNEVYLALNKGYVFTPSRVFSTSSYGIGLKYYLERNGTFSNERAFKKGKFKGVEIVLKQDWYFNAKRITETTEDMHQISLQINLDLNENLFLAGQTSFANFGNAGAYAEGLIGAGIKTNNVAIHNTTLFAQVLAGAAGGGNIGTGEGLIIKPSLGTDYQLNNTLSIRGSIGYVKAKGGSLSNSFINFGLKYNFSFLNMNSL